jgi:hypothetical protein
MEEQDADEVDSVPMATWLALQNRLKMDALLKGKSGNEIIDADCVEGLKM